MSKPIQRTLTLQLTLSELANSLGKSDWTEMNGYLDSDLMGSYWSDFSYSKHGHVASEHKLAVKYCPDMLDRAYNDADAMAHESVEGKCRRKWILDCLNKMGEDSTEYIGEDSDGNEVNVQGITAGVKSASLKDDIVTVEITNPEHFINSIIKSLFMDEDIKVDVALTDERVKSLFLGVLNSYFRCFDNPPSDEFRFEAYPEDIHVTDCLKEMDNQEIAEEVATNFLNLLGAEEKSTLKKEIKELGEFLNIGGLFENVEVIAKEEAEAKIEAMKAKLSKIA